ncbi:hypothetical protein M8J77_003199 [Diaphorina citri]|nr:hypothetical protein M8J77_003199 [Diaphorina citri]
MSLPCEVAVFISNYTVIDPEVFKLWVDGYPSTEAVNILHKKESKLVPNMPIEILAADVLDHYRTYNMFEKLLHYPVKLQTQIAFQLKSEIRNFLIEKYYDLDDSVVREFLGKKLSSRHRKDLDEVSEKTNISLKSCRRQFDNVKRIFKTVDDLPGSVVQNIKKHFLLPDELAKKYGAIVFIASMRFETSKKKLHYLQFADFFKCAISMMTTWTNVDSIGQPDHDDTDIDREFLLELRDLRVLLDKEKEHRHLVFVQIKSKLLDRSYSEFDANFRVYSRHLINLATNLHRTKELRNFFLDLNEKFIEPWHHLNLSKADVVLFLTAYTSAALQLECVQSNGEVKKIWNRYMGVVSECLSRMYHH